MADTDAEWASPAVSASQEMVYLRRECVPYASHYCEENAYKLTEILYRDYSLPEDSVFVVFVSSECRRTPMWRQLLEVGDDPVIWDYHVITVVKAKMVDAEGSAGDTWVFDHDTVLPFPCEGLRYIQESFRPELQRGDSHLQCFRIVPGKVYLGSFSSDRSHMKDSKIAQPPWPPIRGTCAPADMRLELYIDVRRGAVGGGANEWRDCGEVVTITEFVDFMSGP